MCCLFGLIDYGGNLTARQKSRLITALSIAAEERGTDATGIAYNTAHGLHIFKRPVAAHRLHLHIPASAKIVMGHTRMTTQGAAKRNCNNHPFSGVAGKEHFAFAHNGMLLNDLWLRSKYRLPRTKIETDSYVAVQMIEQKQKLDWDSLRDTAEMVEGSFTFTVLSEKDKLYFIKGDSPMKIFYYPTLGVYLYASTENILRSALRGCGNWLGSGVELPISIGEMLSIDDNGIIERANFDAGNLLSYGRYYSTPLYRPAFSPNSSYVQELKDIASAFGYAPEDIDELLSGGFSPEEIEDYFYESREDAYAHIG